MRDFTPSDGAAAMMIAAAEVHAELARPGEELRLVYLDAGLEISIGSTELTAMVDLTESDVGAERRKRAHDVVVDLLAEIRQLARPGVEPPAAGPPTSTAQPEADAVFFGALGPPVEKGVAEANAAAWEKVPGLPPTTLERRADRAIEAAKAGKGKAGTLHRLAWMVNMLAEWPSATRVADLVRVCKNGQVTRQIKRLEDFADGR